MRRQAKSVMTDHRVAYIYFQKKWIFEHFSAKNNNAEKGGEDQDTKTSLIDDVYLQFCHVKKKI